LNKFLLIFSFSLILIPFGNYAFGQITNDPVVVIETNLGNIIIQFFPGDAPDHVNNFLSLSKTGFYDGTLFHRIIPGFMIQGGDPNTINGDPNTWGQGGPEGRTLNAEFNSIEHNRGIVSMARSQDPNSAGSQFFIVHQDSNFLDGQYTVFGRIVNDESYKTLDKIAAVQTDNNDRPIDPDQVRIIKVSIKSTERTITEVEVERTSDYLKSTGNQVFESQDLDIKFSAPEGWLLQQPDRNDIDGAPDVAAVGPKVNGVNPVISLTIDTVGDKTIDDLIKEKNDNLAEAVYLNKLEILSQEKIKSNVYQTSAIGSFEINDSPIKIKFLEVMILSQQKSYTFAYSNTVDNFDNEISRFNESLNSFEILSEDNIIMKTSSEDSSV